MRHAPVPIRGFLHISGLPLTFVGIALFSAKKGHGFFIFYILRAITLKTPLHPRRLDTHSGLDVGERIRSWTYGCKPKELPRAFLSGFALSAVPSKRPQ